MILIDSNIFMYAAGSEHPNKTNSCQFLAEVAKGKIEAMIDAEVLQEILHRYRAIGRWMDGGEVYDLARRIVPIVVPVGVEILDLARGLLDRYERLLARDALHAAAVIYVGAEALCSFDQDFDSLREISRIEPSP